MKIVLALCALVAVALADSGTYEASYYPTEPVTIDTNSGLRVVNGQNARRNQFPYQISLQRRGLVRFSHICGGSIIGKRHILTAAHCVSGTAPSNLQVVAGILLLNDANVAGQQTRSIDQIIIHELYPGGNQVSANDVAIILLSRPLSYSINVQPIAIPRNHHHAQGDSLLSGWGLTRSGGSSPNNLQYVDVPIVNSVECGDILSSYIRNSPFSVELNICSGIRNGGESACNGDSGGPLAQHGKVVGIVSWGLVPCGNLNAPSVYAKVAAYDKWIERKTNGEVRAQ
ncbi:unnamed protein product [Ceutorhynchus assimilis]|uniref:Peptidase S1 domain-containing protein n=1 Tax=Ceutorhynchus assimilis TaxID=467358 RepID=A0A9P0DHQ8_9CUCU|nr:unnamed protein product [Ceutorhynchus assimilis]